MDTFARALVIADKILKESDYLKMRKKRYESFDKGKGKDFEKGKLTLENLREIASKTVNLKREAVNRSSMSN